MRNPKASGLGLLRELEDAAGRCRHPVRVRGRLTDALVTRTRLKRLTAS
jgi:hypothetical protein